MAAKRTQKRRKTERKTDYKLRMNLLKSEKPRIVIRKTNKYLIVQAIESHEAQDKVIAGITSKELLKNGWDKKFAGSLKSLPACYLTGLLLAKKINNKKEFVADFGMARTIYGSRLYAVIKGLIDGGLHIKVNEKVFPSQERLIGGHLKPEIREMTTKIKSKLAK